MVYVGIDLGGTNLKAGVVDGSGKVISKVSFPTRVPCPAEELNAQLAQAALAALELAGVSLREVPWVGAGCPGAVNRETGVVEFSGNLSLKDYPFQALLEDTLQKPVILENDANAAAYGEFQAGALRGAKNAVAVTLGTGIGGGLLLGGRIYAGYNHLAGELGHMVIETGGRPCTCGERGCWETYASATGLVRLTREALAHADRSGALWEMTGGDAARVGGKTAFQAMRAGDETARQVVEQYISYLGCGIVNIVNLLQPEILCVGGGVCNEGDALMIPLREYVARHRFHPTANRQTQIVRAALGNDAGLIGAALLGRDRA